MIVKTNLRLIFWTPNIKIEYCELHVNLWSTNTARGVPVSVSDRPEKRDMQGTHDGICIAHATWRLIMLFLSRETHLWHACQVRLVRGHGGVNSWNNEFFSLVKLMMFEKFLLIYTQLFFCIFCISISLTYICHFLLFFYFYYVKCFLLLDTKITMSVVAFS